MTCVSAENDSMFFDEFNQLSLFAGPINSLILVRTQRGQEYKTGVVMNSKTPQASLTSFYCFSVLLTE